MHKPSAAIIRAQRARLATLRGYLATETSAAARRELAVQIVLLCVRYPAARDAA